MKSLFVSMGIPFPPDRGKRMRNWAFLRVLTAVGDTTLVTFVNSADEVNAADELRNICRLKTVNLFIPKLGSTKDCMARARALFSAKPYGVLCFRSELLTRCLEDLLHRENFDVVICDEIFTLQNLPQRVTAPVLLGKDHIAAMILERYISHESNPLKKFYARLELRRMRMCEPLICHRADAIMACSEVEQRILREMCPGIPVTIAPNVVDVDSYSAIASPCEPVILYQGAMDWFPNQDAVRFFAVSILPLVRKRVPEARFVVAGRGAPIAFVKEFSTEDVSFTGAVADMRPVIAEAAVCVVPLRIAGGTRLKILEAGAMGKAIVSTTIGAEGLLLSDGNEILLADSPQQFADATVSLLTDQALRRKLGAVARRRIETDYSLAALECSIREVVSRVTCKSEVAEASGSWTR